MPTYQSKGGSNEFEILQPGEYDITVVGAEERVSNGGNDMIELICKEENSGTQLWDYLVFTPKAAWKIDEFIAATTGEMPEEGAEINIEAEDLVGQTARVYVDVEKNQKGKEVNKIANWLYEEKKPAKKAPAKTAKGNNPF